MTPPTTPRQSDVSFTSSHTFTSEKPNSPTTTAIPAHPSTSTISRDSHTSSDDPYQLTQILLTRFPESPSKTRLPKAPVFLHTHHRKLRSRQNNQSSPTPSLVITQERAPTTFSNRSVPSPYNDKRCVSDMHDSCQARKRSVYRATTRVAQPPPTETANHPVVLAEQPKQDHLPQWLPPEELHNWQPAPEYDPCIVEDEPSSRWATSMRQISNLYRKDRNPPTIRGSILEVHPPTLTERFGLGSFAGERRHPNRDTRARRPGRGRENRHSRFTYEELHHVHGPPDRIFLPHEDVKELGRDDYVGFLVPSREEKISRPKRGWRRFLRRSRA